MSQESPRTVLYYPTISVPTGTWLRQALLYWDQVASIAPKSWDEAGETYSPDIQFLMSEKQFRPIYPDRLASESYSDVLKLEKEFKSIIQSKRFRSSLGSKDKWEIDFFIHHNKVSDSLFSYLEKKKLAKQQDNSEWFLCERKTAFVYMSVLAKFLTDLDPHSTVPSTDKQEYRDLVYYPLSKSRNKGFSCIEVLFDNILPVPREDVPLADILDFKRNRRSELLRFHKLINSFEINLASASSKSEIRDITQDFKESMEINLSELQNVFRDANLKTTLGSIRSLVNLKSPTFWLATGTLLIAEKLIDEIPFSFKIAGLVTVGGIELLHQIVESSNEERAKLRENGFSYLYHAEKFV